MERLFKGAKEITGRYQILLKYLIPADTYFKIIIFLAKNPLSPDKDRT